MTKYIFDKCDCCGIETEVLEHMLPPNTLHLYCSFCTTLNLPGSPRIGNYDMLLSMSKCFNVLLIELVNRLDT